MAAGEMFPLLEHVYPNSSGEFTVERVPAGTVRLAISDPGSDWEPTTKEVEVNGDMEQIEIVLTRKVELPAPVKPKVDDDEDSTPD